LIRLNEIKWFVKPEMKAKNITEQKENLKRHVIVLWGAKKDVGRNNSSIAKNTNHTSFIAMSVPHTHTHMI